MSLLAPLTILLILLLGVSFTLFFIGFLRWGTRWGATPQECAMRMTGDAHLDGGTGLRAVMMTRAVSIRQPPEVVWPWLAQIGRGAGWYSIDFLDNGKRRSADHIVSWIPQPRLGDASAIGYLAHLNPGRELVWWLSGDIFLGTRNRMVADFQVTPVKDGSRLVIRVSADAAGPAAGLAIVLFQFIDSIMARRQLLGIKERAELYGFRTQNPKQPETGSRDQYQLYEAVFASGEKAGVPGKEKAAEWRKRAIEDGVLPGG